MYEMFMNQLFYYCVRLLEIVAPMLGMTYEEINIWLFVVIHPLLTIIFIVLWLKEKRSQKKKIVNDCDIDLMRMSCNEFKNFVNEVIQEENDVEMDLINQILYLTYKDSKYFSTLSQEQLELLIVKRKIMEERKTA